MKYLSRKEAEKEFDEKFMPDLSKINGGGDELMALLPVFKVKSHISSLRLSDLEAIREHVEGMYKTPNYQAFGNYEQDEHYNQALLDVTAHLTTLEEKLK